MGKFRDLLLGCIIAGLISTCVDQNSAGGGLDTETSGGTVVGMLVAEDGTPGKSAKVFCVPSSYNALRDPQLSDSLVTITDEIGFYHFDRVKKGEYNIQAGSSDKKTNVLICGINVDGDSITVPGGTLHPSATLKIVFPDAVNYASGYCYLPGTTLFAPIQNGLAIVDDVPTGFVPAAYYFDALDSTKNHVIEDGFFISPDDTTVITDFTPWKYSKMVFLNTTATGANITGNVYNFPVLVRLTSNNFDFAGAEAGGVDLRFAKPDYTPLPHEIKQWDAAGQSAEIWVTVDTVFGNDSAQSILMYWGNQDVTGSSSSQAVFDTAKGFVGVWHLGENGDSVFDATANSFNGKKSGSNPAPGMAGNSETFAKENYIRIPGLLNSPSNVTLSAWVRYDTSAGGQDIVSIGDAAFIRADDSIDGIGTAGAYHNDSRVNDSNYVYAASGRFLAKTGWHYLVFSINTAAHVQTFYIDGAQCAISHDVNPIYYAGLGTDTYIGKHGNGKTTFNFIGQIDEVRVSNNVEDPDWVRLCFMNQKLPDALLVW